jgi:5-formyltetrahydrofolate cyclo-ligase
MPKAGLRRKMLESRKALSAEDYMGKSLIIQQRLISTEEYSHSEVLALYSSIKKEVDTHQVIEMSLRSGKKVILPAVSDGRLLFRELKEISDLHKGKYGILEPPATSKVFAPDLADLIVLPGIAFDLKGHRVGYGKGYYDKSLHHLEGQGKLVAVCYDFQLVEEIAGEAHDVKVDMIITEKRIVHTLVKVQGGA